MNTPIAAWPNHGTGEIIVVGSDGQVYAMKRISDIGWGPPSEWYAVGSPLPGSIAEQEAVVEPDSLCQGMFIYRVKTASIEIDVRSPTKLTKAEITHRVNEHLELVEAP